MGLGISCWCVDMSEGVDYVITVIMVCFHHRGSFSHVIFGNDGESELRSGGGWRRVLGHGFWFS
jgi:hypothetical protein